MKGRRCVHTTCCLFLVTVMSVLIGCTPTTAPQDDHGSKAEKGSMNPAYEAQSRAIPPIDAAVPSIFEIASFGLG